MSLVLGIFLWAALGTLVGFIGGDGASWWGGDGSDKGGDWHGRGSWPGNLKRLPEQDGNVTECADFLKSLPTGAIVIPSPADTIDMGRRIPEGERWNQNHWPRWLRNRMANLPFTGTSVDAQDVPGSDTSTFYKSKTYFHVPVTAKDGLFLLGSGRFSVGPVTVVVTEPAHSSGKDGVARVEYEVIARWNDKDLLKSAKVCSLERSSKQGDGMTRGVGIYTPAPEFSDPYRHLSFETIIRIPPGLVSISDLTIDGPIFSPLSLDVPSVQFSTVNLTTQDSTVRSDKPLRAESIAIRNTNGDISGLFNVSETLSLVTSNGGIEASVHLLDSSSHSDANVAVQTTNGNAALTYLSQPESRTLQSSCISNNGRVSVLHRPTFSGTFSLSTTWGRGIVLINEFVKDPSGKDRQRMSEVEKGKGDDRMGNVSKVGKVWWREKGDEGVVGRSHSRVQTTLGEAKIEFR